MSFNSLLPPNAQPGDRAIEAAIWNPGTAEGDAPPISDPATCPAHLLPWLAWGLSIDIWDATWDEATKRAMIADAVARQRRKGSVAAVREVLDAFDADLTIHEWFAQATPLTPYTFEIRLPIEGGATVPAAFIEKVADQVVRVKPARAHFTVAQTLHAHGDIGLIGAARAASAIRVDLPQAPPIDWSHCLLTENGEPMFTESNLRLEEEYA